MIKEFVVEWGYWAIGLGTFFEGETVLIAGGAMAHRGLLSLPLVILSAFVGSVTGDLIWFLMGRRFGRPYLLKKEKWRDRAARIETWVHRYGAWFILGFRFLYGIRAVSPVVLGASGYPILRFACLNLISAAVWATSFGCIGFGLGAGLMSVIKRFGHIYELIALAALFTFAMWTLWRRLKSRAHRKDLPELP